MPIQKFKTFQEASEALWHVPPDDNYYENLREFYKFVRALNPPSAPRGIYFFKTIEEANKHRVEYELQNAIKRKKNMKIIGKENK
jgi:hypothetical protein